MSIVYQVKTSCFLSTHHDQKKKEEIYQIFDEKHSEINLIYKKKIKDIITTKYENVKFSKKTIEQIINKILKEIFMLVFHTNENGEIKIDQIKNLVSIFSLEELSRLYNALLKVIDQPKINR